MAQLNIIILQILVIALSIVAIIPIINNWKDSKNRMYLAVIIYTAAVISNAIFESATYIINVDINIKLIGALRIGFIIGYIMFAIQAEFLLYLKKLTKFYTLPIIIIFYLICANILIDNSMPFIIFAIIIAFVPAYILLKEGKRNRNGLAVGMGLLFVMWGIGQSVPVLLIAEIFKVIAIILYVLGTKGFYEKYVFPNQEEEAKIMGTWIAKFVAKE